MSRISYKLALTGDKELDRKLKAIAEGEGPKSINKEMRKTTRDAIKSLVLPQVRSEVPELTGFLLSNVTVKAIKRSRSKLGTAVGFRHDLFSGDTFYAGFLEYGFTHWSGTVVYGDSFLRRPLYQSEGKVKNFVRGRMRRWVKARNR